MDFTTTLTPLEITGNVIQLLLLVVLPTIVIITLIIKYPKVALELIKIVFEFIKTHGPIFVWNGLRFLLWALRAGGAGSATGSSNSGFEEEGLSAKQKHDMDSNGLSRSEAIRNPHW